MQPALAAIVFAALRRFGGTALFPGPRPSSSQGAPSWPSGLTVRRSRPPTAAAELRALERIMPTAMYALLPLLMLVVLLGFVVWDRRRLQSRPLTPLPRAALTKGWSQRPLLVWPMHAALSLCAAALTVAEFKAPSLPPFAGRWSFIKQLAFSTFGTFGLAYVWSAMSLLLLLLALATWRNRTQVKSSALPPNAL